MNSKKTIVTAQSVSPVRALHAFMADKRPHSWCGIGSKSPIPVAEGGGDSTHNREARGNDTATDETGSSRSHIKHGAARSPPNFHRVLSGNLPKS